MKLDRKWQDTHFHLRQQQEILATNNKNIANQMKVRRLYDQERDTF